MCNGKLGHRRNVVVILRDLLAVDAKPYTHKSSPPIVNECCRPIPRRRFGSVRSTVLCVSALSVGNRYVWFRQDCRVLNTCQEGSHNNSAYHNRNNDYSYDDGNYSAGAQSSLLR